MRGCGRAGDVGGCGAPERAERAGRRRSSLRYAQVRAGSLEARTPGSPSPAAENVDKCATPTPVWPAGQGTSQGSGGKGLPEGADNGGRAAGGYRAELFWHRWARSGLGREKPRWRAGASGWSIRGPAKSPALPPCVPSPTRSFPPQVPRTPPGEELAEPQAAGGGQKKGDKTPGGGGANLKGDRSRLLRDLRVDTKSRGAWARLLHEHPNARKYKGGNKKGLSKGCFGLKLDRIGSMSGLGC